MQEHDALWNEAAQHSPAQCEPDSGVVICPMPKLVTGHELVVELYPDVGYIFGLPSAAPVATQPP